MKRLHITERILILLIVLLAWALRWVQLMDVPPGWRDDDLIEVYTFSNEILTSGPRLYYPEAAGQGPFYHTIRAPVLYFGGVNQASVRWLSAVCGTIAVLLTWAVGRRMFTGRVGILAGALAAVSFWSLMYSRVAIRHIGALPWMLLAVYWGWRLLKEKRHPALAMIGTASGTTASMLTYYAGRLIPPLLLAMLVFTSSRKQQRKKFLIALFVGLLLTVPTFVTAFFTPGADARVGELAHPIRTAMAGDFKPLLQNAWITLGMFHAQGDPEWLYNIPLRPVFNPLTAAIFYISLLLQLLRVKNDNSRLLLIWLAAGISPALISHPPSSLGHTILAQPVTCILLASLLTFFSHRWRKVALLLGVFIFGYVALRDTEDYFIKWPRYSMVGFLYRGDYRIATQYFDAHPEIVEAAVGTMLFGSWDKVALETDILRQDTVLRWVNPDRALVSNSSGTLIHYLQEESAPVPIIQEILDAAPTAAAPLGLRGYRVNLPNPLSEAIHETKDRTPLYDVLIKGSMALEAVEPQLDPNGVLWIKTWWRVASALPLPPEKLYPPPPGVYGGPRLRVFAHLLDGEQYTAGDDGLWVDPYSLRVGDRLLQVHRFEVGEIDLQNYDLGIGLYDPMTGERWQLPDGTDQLIIDLEL